MEWEVLVEKSYWKYYTAEADTAKGARDKILGLADREAPSEAGGGFSDFNNSPSVESVEPK